DHDPVPPPGTLDREVPEGRPEHTVRRGAVQGTPGLRGAMTATRVRVALVPPAPGSLPAETCAVAIDVLRATTTLAVARMNGAAGVVRSASPAEALAFRARTAGTLACGERDGRIVEGFDLGNSPEEFTRERVNGKTLAFASTNGSRALLAASRCPRRRLRRFPGLVPAPAGPPARARDPPRPP